MKKFYSLSLLMASSMMAMAQLPVSTTAENKNVVLEEFTGIYCTFCPDGHLRAQNFADANPGDVVLINIHEGGYAAPSNGDPDFRTQWGAAIDGQTNLAGYPAGTINRREFTGMQQNGSGTAMSRGDWATAGGMVLTEPSYVNIAIEGDIDYVSNTLTVDVETYFTGAAPNPTVKLNVAVLQSGVEGPQTGMAANPNQILPNGNYAHNHMLRDLLTGQWGADISSAMGVVGTHQYTWPIPADINGIPVSIGDLSIVAFIAEGNQTIISGAEGPVTFTLPAGVSTADAEAVNSMTTVSGYCNTTFDPEFTIKNNESFALDSCEAIFTFNGGTPISQWVTNIPANGTKTVTFATTNLAPGTNTLGFTASMHNVYKYLDVNNGNNNAAGDPINVISSNVHNFPTAQGFENDAPFSTPADLLLEDESGRVWIVDRNITNPPLSNAIGGYSASEQAYRFDFASIAPNSVSSIVTEKIDLKGAPEAEIQFDLAYAIRGTVAGDKFAGYLSGDCGVTWVKFYEEIGGSGLESANPTGAQNRFYPQAASDWKTLSAFIPDANGSEIIIKFEGTSAGGNALYLDNIMVDGFAIGIAEVATIETSVYPNPASDVFFIELEEAGDFTVEITNSIGQAVSVSEFVNTNKAEINTSDLTNGVYIININSDKGASSKKLTISK